MSPKYSPVQPIKIVRRKLLLMHVLCAKFKILTKKKKKKKEKIFLFAIER